MHPASTLSLFMYTNFPDSSVRFLCKGLKTVKILHEQVLQWGPATQRRPDGAPANLADCTVDVHDMPMMTVKLGTRNKRCLTVKGCWYRFLVLCSRPAARSCGQQMFDGGGVHLCVRAHMHSPSSPDRTCCKALLVAILGRQADAEAIGVLIQTLLPALPLNQAVVSAAVLLLLLLLLQPP